MTSKLDEQLDEARRWAAFARMRCPTEPVSPQLRNAIQRSLYAIIAAQATVQAEDGMGERAPKSTFKSRRRNRVWPKNQGPLTPDSEDEA